MISAVMSQGAVLLQHDLPVDAAIAVSSVDALAPVGTGSALLPQNADLAFVGASKADSFAIRQVAMGSAQIELGEGYSLFVNDRDRQLVLENVASASKTTIFGDARIGTATSEPLQFWGTTTLAFGNDGKITLETSEAADQPGSFLLERIAVSNGPRAVVITGVADEKVDKLTIQQSNGYDLDYETRDGFVLEQAGDGSGWVTEYGDTLTQALLDDTAVGAIFGPGSSMLSLGEFSALISNYLLSIGSAFSTWLAPGRLVQESHYDTHRHSSDRQSIERRSIEKLIFEQSFQRQLYLNGAACVPRY